MPLAGIGAQAPGDRKVKKTIWMPLVLGGALGLLDLVSLAVDFPIPLGPLGATGPQEILLTMSAALGGPLGVLAASPRHELGITFFFLSDQLPPEQMSSTGALFSVADLVAHILALLAVAYGYRFLQTRAKKVATFCAGWVLIVVLYYGFLVPLQSFLLGLVIADKPTLSALFQNNLPEFLVVVIITTLFILALPRRYRRPLWYDPKQAPDRTRQIRAEQKVL